MDNVHHKPIKKFEIDGVIRDDSSLWRMKEEYKKLLTSEMRLSGYVPRLDINPDFTVSYNQDKQSYEFKISMYGIYIGKKQSQWIAGIDDTRVVYILPNKSNESSGDLESPLSQK